MQENIIFLEFNVTVKRRNKKLMKHVIPKWLFKKMIIPSVTVTKLIKEQQIKNGKSTDSVKYSFY